MFHYYIPPPTPGTDAHVAVVAAGRSTVRELMEEIRTGLRFPGYCGLNLDAFWDCVRVLEGIDARRVALVHRDLPALPDDRLAAYIELLRDTVLYWRARADEHCFEAWFPAVRVDDVKAMLNSLPPPEAAE